MKQTMKLVLLEDIASLGTAGSVVDVSSGYARNFLVPKKLAEYATKDILNRVEQIKAAAVRKREKVLTEVRQAFEIIQNGAVTIKARAGAENKLFGAITTSDIKDAIKSTFGVTVDKKWIEAEPIHYLGEFPVEVKFSQDAKASLTVTVAPEEGEA